MFKIKIVQNETQRIVKSIPYPKTMHAGWHSVCVCVCETTVHQQIHRYNPNILITNKKLLQMSACYIKINHRHKFVKREWN